MIKTVGLGNRRHSERRRKNGQFLVLLTTSSSSSFSITTFINPETNLPLSFPENDGWKMAGSREGKKLGTIGFSEFLSGYMIHRKFILSPNGSFPEIPQNCLDNEPLKCHFVMILKHPCAL